MDMHSTATLYELDMPEEPTKTKLLIKESHLGPPEKVKVCGVCVCVCVWARARVCMHTVIVISNQCVQLCCTMWL